MSNIHYTIATRNSKTGPMLVTTSSADTCPSTCPFNGHGCYAQMGPILIHWRKVNSGERAKEWEDFLHAIRKQQKGVFWRMNQAGDLPGIDNDIDENKLNDVIEANRGRRGFTYTHKELNDRNRALIKDANDRGFTINLSADNLNDADEKVALNTGPVVVPISSKPEEWPTHTPGGNRVVVCPNSTKDLTCAECGLCQRVNRKSIVGFPAHGVKKRAVEAIVR